MAAGVQLRLIVPTAWPGPDDGPEDEPYDVVQLQVHRPGDVNRHRYRDKAALARAIQSFQPDLVDVHEEPVSVVARQVLQVIGDLPVVMYSAQNLDKRWPPPFRGYERQALARVQAFYPCSRQAAAVLELKGYGGLVEPLALGVDPAVHAAGEQRPGDGFTLGLVGRLVPEKGLRDAIEVLADVERGTRLIVVGAGPELVMGQALATARGVSDDVEWVPWSSAPDLAALYRRMHVVLVPSRATATWVEQFGRVITEGCANGAVPVGYASGSVGEVIGDAGVVVPEGDVGAMVRAVRELMSSPQDWQDLRARGLARARAIEWPGVAAAQAALYERARAASPPGGPGSRRTHTHWGRPAANSVSSRPLALPVLRQSKGLHRLLDRWPDVRRLGRSAP